MNQNKVSLISVLRKRERILFLSRCFFHDRGFIDLSPLSTSLFEKESIKKAFSFDGENLCFFSRSDKELKKTETFFQSYLVFLFEAFKRKSFRLGEKSFTPFTLKYAKGRCVLDETIFAEWSLDSNHFSGRIAMDSIFEVFECKI
ncbi:MAG: hypothetical protein JXR30_02080 [Alphaproteobacteria bacterium]|nr:hypothetical protein [Alphaproteobacteria bacterium]